MTLQERIAAVMALGFSARHAEFITAVALHSGFCVRRQYEAFANVQPGKNVRDFLDGMVSRGLAARFSPRANRGYIVTNAKMFAANYDPADVDLESGQFKGTPSDIKPIAWARFSKSFSAKRDSGNRTVLVVQAASLVEFLDKLEWIGAPEDSGKVHVP